MQNTETVELTLPKVLGATDIQDLNPKFEKRFARFNGGRGNEVVFQELQKKTGFTSYYTGLLLRDYDITTYRYVSGLF